MRNGEGGGWGRSWREPDQSTIVGFGRSWIQFSWLHQMRKRMYLKVSRWPIMALVMFLAACSSGDSQSSQSTKDAAETDLVRIALEGEEAERLLRFYFGSYMGPHGGDPIEAGLLEKREKAWFLRNPDTVEGEFTLLSSLFAKADESGSISEDALKDFVQETYYNVRPFPETLEELKTSEGSWDSPEWFRIDLRGSMVPLKRQTLIRRTDIEAALDRMNSLDDPILYEPGTTMIGEHVDGEVIVETTVMRKRADGFWDYWAYDATGALTDIIRKEPRDMLVPTRCTGCHFGDRLFEPERSFPGVARSGPSGERALYVPDNWRNAGITSALQEHARRSDSVLGLYATLYLAEASAAAASGTESPSPYLEKFGIAPGSQ